MRSSAATLKPKPNQAPEPIDALALRAWARAYMWAAGEIKNIPDAVDPLQTFAIESGLVAEIGQDTVQKILGDAFAPYCYDAAENSADDGLIFCDICCNLCRDDEARRRRTPPIKSKPERRSTPRTTIEAIMWCVRERGPQALHEPENIERLSRCDDAAISEIDQRISKLRAGNES